MPFKRQYIRIYSKNIVKEYLDLSIKRLNLGQRKKQNVKLEIQNVEKDIEKQLTLIGDTK